MPCQTVLSNIILSPDPIINFSKYSIIITNTQLPKLLKTLINQEITLHFDLHSTVNVNPDHSIFTIEIPLGISLHVIPNVSEVKSYLSLEGCACVLPRELLALSANMEH